MDFVVVIVVSVITTFGASTGFWTYLLSKREKNSATTRLLMGLGYDKIAQNGMRYIERGWITKNEYEDFRKYLYEPYSELGGNGTASHIMDEVSRLPLKNDKEYSDIIQAHQPQRGVL